MKKLIGMMFVKKNPVEVKEKYNKPIIKTSESTKGNIFLIGD